MLHVEVDLVRDLRPFGSFAGLGEVQEGSGTYQQQADNDTLNVRHVEYGHPSVELTSTVGVGRTSGRVLQGT